MAGETDRCCEKERDTDREREIAGETDRYWENEREKGIDLDRERGRSERDTVREKDILSESEREKDIKR